MLTLTDQNNQPAAFLHNNVLLLPEKFDIIGVVIGQCVYGTDGKLKGKLFHKTMYSINGETIGKESTLTQSPKLDSSEFTKKLWQLLQKIRDHQTPWINPKETWASRKLTDVLFQ